MVKIGDLKRLPIRIPGCRVLALKLLYIQTVATADELRRGRIRMLLEGLKASSRGTPSGCPDRSVGIRALYGLSPGLKLNGGLQRRIIGERFSELTRPARPHPYKSMVWDGFGRISRLVGVSWTLWTYLSTDIPLR